MEIKLNSIKDYSIMILIKNIIKKVKLLIINQPVKIPIVK